jgi:hypothetical protein
MVDRTNRPSPARDRKFAHISKGLIDDARGEESVGGRSLHALGERLANNTHLKSLVTIRGAESSNWTSLADLTEPGWRHAGRECHDGKALVRAVTQGRGGFPGGGAAVLRKARRAEDTLFPRHTQPDTR